jgi:3-hydroxyacyl-[acyl-carrier-protein] dehydratase
MRFCLLDRILSVQPGKSITAIKTVSLAEEYLGDHFPRFPVLPGVLMLEALTQAAAWTIRLGEDFAHSIVVLRTAKNVKYGDFVQPGRTLTVAVEVLEQDETTTRVKATGSVGEKTSLTARLTLERYNLADRFPHGDALDARVRAEMRPPEPAGRLSTGPIPPTRRCCGRTVRWRRSGRPGTARSPLSSKA